MGRNEMTGVQNDRNFTKQHHCQSHFIAIYSDYIALDSPNKSKFKKLQERSFVTNFNSLMYRFIF